MPKFLELFNFIGGGGGGKGSEKVHRTEIVSGSHYPSPSELNWYPFLWRSATVGFPSKILCKHYDETKVAFFTFCVAFYLRNESSFLKLIKICSINSKDVKVSSKLIVSKKFAKKDFHYFYESCMEFRSVKYSAVFRKLFDPLFPGNPISTLLLFADQSKNIVQDILAKFDIFEKWD